MSDQSATAAPAPRMEVMPQPREGRLFPCAQCGAGLKYEPGATDLKCQYCGHQQHIPQSPEEVQELAFERYFHLATVPQPVYGGAIHERRCTGCGAMLQIPAAVATEQCPFCDTHLTNPIESPTPAMAPAGVLPFLIDRNSAHLHFTQWVKSRWFAPSALKKLADLQKINGLYVPYWTYDAMTYSFYTGQRGDAYYVTVGSGKNRRTERRVRWTSVSGRINHWFDDVLVCSSQSLPAKHVAELEPWDLKDVKPFREEFLSGFRSERYQMSARDGFTLARGIMDSIIASLIRQDIGGDEQRINSVQTQVDNVTFKLLLLPLWLAVYQLRKEVYRVFVNARTGEVKGDRPYSAVKITFAVIFALIIITLIVVGIIQNG